MRYYKRIKCLIDLTCNGQVSTLELCIEEGADTYTYNNYSIGTISDTITVITIIKW